MVHWRLIDQFLQTKAHRWGSSETELEKRRLYTHSDEKDIPLRENVDYIRSKYSQHLMSLASATAYGLVGLLMGFVNKVSTLPSTTIIFCASIP